MIIEDKFLMPDYYSNFLCKMGACRTACCEGWPISLSVADYFKLLGIGCSPELRKSLDCGMHLAEHPIPEAYAQITPRYDGQCPMRMDDGRCGIQSELGEDALASVCRLYPRGFRLNNVRECSCANSCEAVLELLLHKAEPITFQHRNLSFSVPEIQSLPDSAEPIEKAQEIRLWLISLIQERKYPLNVRIMIIGKALERLEDALKSHDSTQLGALIRTHDIESPFSVQSQETLCRNLDKAKEILHYLTEGSASLTDYVSAAIDDYKEANHKFVQLLPKWELWFEHILVNHMFFTQFPFDYPPAALHDKFLALCVVYVLMRYLCLGCNAKNITEIVDAVAAIFRLVDHTDFDRYAAHILKKMNCMGNTDIWQLLCI